MKTTPFLFLMLGFHTLVEGQTTPDDTMYTFWSVHTPNPVKVWDSMSIGSIVKTASSVSRENLQQLKIPPIRP